MTQVCFPLTQVPPEEQVLALHTVFPDQNKLTSSYSKRQKISKTADLHTKYE